MTDKTQQLINTIELRYNADHDCPSESEPLVTWTDYTLLEIIRELQKTILALQWRVTELEKSK